eukprot:138622-Prorocentrum_lima.AAC.1
MSAAFPEIPTGVLKVCSTSPTTTDTPVLTEAQGAVSSSSSWPAPQPGLPTPAAKPGMPAGQRPAFKHL